MIDVFKAMRKQINWLKFEKEDFSQSIFITISKKACLNFSDIL